MMDGEKSLTVVHPVLGVTYPAPGEVFPMEPKKLRRSTHLSLVTEREDEDGDGDDKEEEPLQVLPPDDPRHGKVEGYRKNCKCEPCKAAWREKCNRERQARFAMKLDPEDPRHGTPNFYSNYGCRCRKCTDAQNLADPRISHESRGSRPKARRPRPEELAASTANGSEQQEMAS